MNAKNKKIYITSDDVKSFLTNTKQITFEITDACNLKCEYCGYGKFYSDYDKRENNFLKLEYAKKFLDYMFRLWQSPFNKSTHSKLAVSFYGGEPLMNMNFIHRILIYSRQYDDSSFGHDTKRSS
jgi:uncharacterized protein